MIINFLIIIQEEMKYLLTAIYLFFTTSGIFLLKAGGDSMQISLAQGIEFKMRYMTLVGFCCYVISFLLWQKLLVTYDLSYIVPLTTGISQIIILIVRAIGFHEKINWMSIVGVLAIGIGVALIAMAKK